MLARGTYLAAVPATPTKPALVKFGVPNTSYEMHLLPQGTITAVVGKRLIGSIHAQARRIDVVNTGGQYVEPVFGRPRRVQGTVIGIKDGAVVVDAGVPIHCTPTGVGQKAEQFSVGQFVSFDVMDGATMKQA